MRFKSLFFIAAVSASFLFTSCAEDQSETTYRYNYESVDNDPLGAKLYTLENGLKVYISENREEPRVVTQIAVRTGSKQDPADATGLAHYLEHMLFKGSSRMGTKNWEEEKVLLQKISDLYEVNRASADDEERKRIYAQIDSLSGIAAGFAISNEYDKMISSLGARGTNAYTSNEQTVYINDIPSNELEKWAAIEAERFSELVLRLFHTELEVVYEEFNRGQDSDFRLAYYALMENIFPNHQYGTQTTIGTSEHLKAPSMEKIHEYFRTHYIPNNMAIVLAGDVNPDDAVDVIKKYFGDWAPGELPEFEAPEEAPITEPIVKDVTGVDAAFVTIGYRMPGVNEREALLMKVTDGILSNGQAGLIDLNLVQKQKILSGYSTPYMMHDYSVFNLQGVPRGGQSPEEVADLLRGQLDLVKAGDFPDWMVEAVINDMKLNDLRRTESNWARASQMVNAFVYFRDWEDVVNEFDIMDTFTKDDIVAFANEWFGDNYVQINKRTGANMAVKVEKPQITPVNIDRETKSAFYIAWDSIESGRLEPQFLDYDELIKTKTLKSGLEFNSIKNENNELFSLYYILDMGTDNDLEAGIAVSYLPYLGTNEYTAEELAQEMFKLGVSFDVFSSRDRTYVTLRGLNSSLEKGMELFEHILANVEPDETALNDMVDGILKKRSDALKSKGQILNRAMLSYAQYGPENPFKHQLSEEELRALDAEALTDKIKGITGYKHHVFYYGPDDAATAMKKIDTYHKVDGDLREYPEPKIFEELPIDNDNVYFTHFDMVQSEIMLVSKGPLFQKGLLGPAGVYNQYFGSGLSSIVFQEIRESKALAYSAYSVFTSPDRIDKSHYVRAYLGAQVDKLPEATDAMLELMAEIPRSDIQFESAREAAMKQIEANRITRESIFWSYLTAKRRGLDYDIRRENYEALKTMTFEDLEAFFNTHIKGNKYTYLVIGNESMVALDALENLGPVRTLTLEELFGYGPEDEEVLSMKN